MKSRQCQHMANLVRITGAMDGDLTGEAVEELSEEE